MTAARTPAKKATKTTAKKSPPAKATKPVAKKTPGAKARDTATKPEPKLAAGATSTPPRSTPSDVLERITVPLAKINPSTLNPRSDVGDVTDLAASIAEVGLLQPLVVAPLEGGDYELVAGERRWTALKLLKAKTADVIVRDIEADVDVVLAAFAENTQRLDLSELDQARGYRTLIDSFGLTQADVAKRVKVSPAHVTKRLALLTLPGTVQKQISAGKLDVTAAYEISRLGKLPDGPKVIAEFMRDELRDDDSTDEVAARVADRIEAHENETLAATVADKFKADGVDVLDPAYVARNKYPRVKKPDNAWGSDLAIDPKAHAKEPCRAITVAPGYGDKAKPIVVEYCTDPARHAKKGASELKAPKPRSSSTASAKDRDRAAADREANKHRTAFMRAAVNGNNPDKPRTNVAGAVIQLLALQRYVTSGWSVEARATCELLGLEPITVDRGYGGKTKDWPGTLAKFVKDADEPTLLRLALAKAFAEGETRHERTAAHRAFLLDLGYEPTDHERKQWNVKPAARPAAVTNTEPDPLVTAHEVANSKADDYFNACSAAGVEPGAEFDELDAELKAGCDTIERVAEIDARLEAMVLEVMPAEAVAALDAHNAGAAMTIDDAIAIAAANVDITGGAAEPMTLDVDELDTATLDADALCPYPNCRLAAEHDEPHDLTPDEPLLDAYANPPINKHEEWLRGDIAKLMPDVPAVVALQQELYRGVTLQRIAPMMKEVKALAATHSREF